MTMMELLATRQLSASLSSCTESKKNSKANFIRLYFVGARVLKNFTSKIGDVLFSRKMTHWTTGFLTREILPLEALDKECEFR